MKQVEDIIGDLLLRHNCVVIPLFGGFVTKQVSAYIDYESGTMFPPKKSLLFNRQLINNDGLLITELATINDVGYQQAEKQLIDKVAIWNHALRNGERVSIDRVGFLYFDAEKNICFEQDRFFNLLLESYGLGKVHFLSETEVSIAQHQVEIHPVKVAEESVVVPKLEVVKSEIIESAISQPTIKMPDSFIEASKKSRTKVWKYVAAACFLPFAFYTVWIPMNTDVLESGIISFHDFNPFNKTAPAEYKMQSLNIETRKLDNAKTLKAQLDEVETDISSYQFNFTDDLFLTVKTGESGKQEIQDVETPIVEEPTVQPKIEKSIEAKVEKVKEPKAEKETFSKNKLNYVVGAFGDKNNALSLVATLKAQGMNASIVGVHGGMYRVSAGGASNESDFAKIISKADAAGLDGWVME